MNKEVIINIENPKDNDLISRQAVLDLIVANHTELNGLNVVMYSPLYKDIMQLPSVKPQEPKTGHWIFKHFDEDTGISDSYWCSECNKPLESAYKNFCSNCGAKMVEEQEVRDK